jgi:hypothetical protein
MIGWRVRRGFRRLGLVVAAPALALALGALVLVGIASLLPAAPQPECLEPTLSGPEFYQCLERQGADARATSNFLTFAAMSATISVLWFAACWAIGWVLAGFARDQAPGRLVPVGRARRRCSICEGGRDGLG